MPFYEYQCQACHEHVEVLQKISEAPLVDCPECGKPELKKLVSAAGFRLKGGGWYETDFKNNKKRNLHESGDGKKSETTSDAKPESKSGDSGSTDKSKTSAGSGDSGKKAASS